MREIKFRAKPTDSDKWLYGSSPFYDKQRGMWCMLHLNEIDSLTLTFINPDTSGQFTGLYDVNGHEIWEGDIVEYRHPYHTRTGIYEIVYDPPMFGGAGFRMGHHDNPDDIFSEGADKLEVLGNIYENRDLLDGDD